MKNETSFFSDISADFIKSTENRVNLIKEEKKKKIKKRNVFFVLFLVSLIVGITTWSYITFLFILLSLIFVFFALKFNYESGVDSVRIANENISLKENLNHMFR